MCRPQFAASKSFAFEALRHSESAYYGAASQSFAFEALRHSESAYYGADLKRFTAYPPVGALAGCPVRSLREPCTCVRDSSRRTARRGFSRRHGAHPGGHCHAAPRRACGLLSSTVPVDSQSDRPPGLPAPNQHTVSLQCSHAMPPAVRCARLSDRCSLRPVSMLRLRFESPRSDTTDNATADFPSIDPYDSCCFDDGLVGMVQSTPVPRLVAIATGVRCG